MTIDNDLASDLILAESYGYESFSTGIRAPIHCKRTYELIKKYNGQVGKSNMTLILKAWNRGKQNASIDD